MPRGGKRPGAGAPTGNTNALKHGLRTRDPALKKALAAFPGHQAAIIQRIISRRTGAGLINGRTPTEHHAWTARFGPNDVSLVTTHTAGQITNIRAYSTKTVPGPDRGVQLDGAPDSAKQKGKRGRGEAALQEPPFCHLCHGPQAAKRVRLRVPDGYVRAIQWQCANCRHFTWPRALQQPLVLQPPRRTSATRSPSRSSHAHPYWTRD